MKNIKRVLAVVMAIGMLVCCLVANTIAAEVPDLPTATATAIEKDGLTYAMNFKADSVSDAQLNYYGEWFADFELTFNKTVTLDANGGADGYLAGQYDGEWKDESWSWSGEWVNVPFKPVTLEANKPLKIMAYAAELLGEPGLKYTYKEVYEVVKDFNCGLYLTDEFLTANPDLEIKLELKMYNPKNEAQGYIIGETYYFAKTYDAYIVETGKKYETVSEATSAAVSGQTVCLLNNATSTTVVGVLDGVTLDLNGYTLTTDYLLSTGDVVDNSADNSGKLVARRIVLREDNNQLPINNADGSIKFYDVVRIQHATLAVAGDPDAIKYAFSPTFEAAANEALLNGGDVSGVNILVRVTWDRNDGTVGSQDFVYNDTWVKEFVNSYKPATGKYSAMFTLVIDNYKNYTNLKYQAYVVSEYDPEFTIDKVTTKEVNLTDNSGSTAVVPSGTMLSGNTTTSELVLNVTDMEKSGSNIALEENEVQKSVDVHVNGVSKDNKVPLIVTVKKMAEAGLNNGNLKLYHVENGKTNLMTQVWSLAEVDKHNEFYYDPATGDVTMALATFSEIAVVSEEDAGWKGEYNYTWYNKDAKELFIANADQLAAFGQIVGGMAEGIERDNFEGKTVKLLSDINLADGENWNNRGVTANNGVSKIFHPIGYYYTEDKNEDSNTGDYYSTVYSFKGTFDGNGHTIANFYHNTWEIKGDYDGNYYDVAMGLFGYVNGGKVLNVTVDNFSSDGEFTPTGVIAAYANNAEFKNIAITNCNPRVYNTGNGGIIGVAGNSGNTTEKITLTNITVDNSNKITALWGSWDVACGGLVGMFRGNDTGGKIHFENCHVSAQIDVFNDVCANYQYYAYRYSGMIIGSVRANDTKTIPGKTLPLMDGITASGCTVHFGDWNDYYYCELVANSLASYTHDHQFSRLEQVSSVDVENMKVTSLDGKTTAIPTSGRYNYVVVTNKDENGLWIHGDGEEYATCYHFVNGEVHEHENAGTETVNGEIVLKEDKQLVYREFNQLFTGYGWGVTSKGISDYPEEQIDILDREAGNSVTKFEASNNLPTITVGSTVYIGELFQSIIGCDVDLVEDAIHVSVTDVNNNDGLTSAIFTLNTDNWKESTLVFNGVPGDVKITIQDYYFCVPTTIDFAVGEVQKFEKKFTGDFLYRVGNQGTVSWDKLFKAKNGVEVGTVAITVESIEGSKAGGSYKDGAIQFTGTGVVKVTITDNNYCKPTELILEVVDATNVTGAASATSNNVVLLNDAGLSSMTVSGRYTFYGNGFTLTYSDNGQYLRNGLNFGVVTVKENGTLDNVRIKASIYPAAYLYYGTNNLGAAVQDAPNDGNERYAYQLSAVSVSENATISNCYIYGGRNNVFVNPGNVIIKDSVLECGTVANIQIESNDSHTITLENVTTIQHQVNATIGDTSKVMLGAGVLVGPNSTRNPKIVLKGNFKQYNWVNEADKDAVSDSSAKTIIGAALDASDYNHTINGQKSSNLGIIVMNTTDITIEKDFDIPYVLGTISMNGVSGRVYSLQGATTEQIYSDYANADKNTVNGLYKPQFKYPADLGHQYIEKTDDGDEHFYREGDTIKVMFPSGDTKEINLATLVNISKYAGQNLNLLIVCKDENGNAVTVTDGMVSLSIAGEYTVTYTVTDTLFYDKDGKTVSGSKSYSWDITVSVSLKDTAVPDARFEFDASKQTMGYGKLSGLAGLGKSNFQYLPFLAGLKIWDYNGQDEYLRFDGNTDFVKIAKVDLKCESEQAYVTVTLTDGGVINIHFGGIADSGSKTKTGTIKVSNNVVYYVCDGDTGATTTTWTIKSYSFIGNNGVEIKDTTQVFNNCVSGTIPTGSFGTTIKYTVTYDANGGNCGQNTGYATSAATAVTLPTPTRSGYIFAGWYTAASGGDKIEGSTYKPSANITLYAQWGKPCTVTYNANGGNCGTASEKYTGTALILPTPTRDGYWFVGWYDAANGGNKIGDAGAVYNPTGDITLYAHWQEKVDITVTYNANGGTCGTVSATYQGAALTLPTPTRTGYTFNGWYTAASGGTKIGDAGASYTPPANITLYAQWTQMEYTITITSQSNATVTIDKSKAHYGDTVSVTVTFKKTDSKTLTVKDSSNNTILSKSDAGTYTFTMPASNVTISASSKDPSCVTGDTLVTLADGTQKRIDEVTYNDQLLVWNHFTGSYDVAPAAIIFNHGYANNTIIKLSFSDGTVVKIVNLHQFYDTDLNKYVSIDAESVAQYVGHGFAKQYGDGFITVTLDSYEVSVEYESAYGMISAFHYNIIVEGMISTNFMPDDYDLFNYFELGENMAFDKAQMQADIEKYGLYTYEDFADYLTYEQFVGFNVQYFKIAVGKGNYTYEGILELIDTYLNK